MQNRSGGFILLLICLKSLGAGWAWSQDYPNRTVRIIGGDTGSATDTFARLIGQGMTGPLGQPIVVENRPTTVTPEVLAKSPPDGYTLGIAGSTTWITPLIQKTSYDPLRDFAPITSVASYPYLLVVHPSLPVRSVQQLIDLAKARPGVLNVGATASPGGASFLATELFKVMAGVNVVRVPYKSNAQAMIALLAGQIDLMFHDVGAVGALAKIGKVRPLAVTSLKPFALAPDLPTVSASGLTGFEMVTILGMLAPGATPGPIIERLHREITRVLNTEEVRTRFLNAGVETATSSPEQFSATIKSEMAKWGKVVKDAGIKAD